MKTCTNKRLYGSPKLERILLDNEISLVLDSSGLNPWSDPSMTANLNESSNELLASPLN